MWNGTGWGMGWGGMGIGMAVIWILVILAVAALVMLVVNRPAGSSEDRSIEIARERYARGEITREQFDELKSKLEK
jgi:putative membrane protein